MQASSVRQSSHLLSFRLVSIFTVAIIVALIVPACLFAQVSGSISGTVQDSTGAAVPGAKVGLVNEASQEARESVSNGSGYFTFSAVTPGTYTVSAEAKGFKSWKQSGIVIHTGDVRTLSNLALEVGTTSEVVEVTATAQSLVPVDSGAREDVLSIRDVQDLPLVSRNVAELLKVLPGVTSTANGTANGVGFNFLNTGVNGSPIGVGLDTNGSANRGGTSYISDGANIIDPGCNCWSVALVDSKFTQEVQVQSSNFGADVQKGPVVVNATGKSGTREYHGEAYFDARNDVLNANDWQSNSAKIPRGSAHYYYPGGSFGGPVPFTNKKLFFWVGYEHFLQNLGNAASLTSYIPAAGMMQGNFTSSGTGVAALCPNLDANGNNTDTASTHAGTACASINGPAAGFNNVSPLVLPDGSTVSNGIIPPQFLDPGAAALSSIWPAANITDAATIQRLGGNYFQSFPTDHNGYMYRMRFDYDLNDSNKFFVSYQYGKDAQPVNGNGAHVWYTPGNSIPFPGGGIQTIGYAKVGTAHFVHVFGPSMTNEFIASWGWGSGPNTADLSKVTKTALNYPSTYGTVFKNPAIHMIPSNYSAGNFTFPEFSQPDLFEFGGAWQSKKQMPSFADNFTKVWRTHTIKIGGYYETTGNIQAGFNFANGVYSFGQQHPDFFNQSGPAIGSAANPLSDFVTGIANNYQESSSEPYQDMAYRTLSGYFDDSWKATRRLTVQFGLRFDHIGRWYDRQETGMATFFQDLVAADAAIGRQNPGVRYHGIDPGVPNGGSPVRLAFVSPRFGIAYDVFGTGKTVVRGGWGRYRWNDQVNDYLGMLQTSQGLKTFNLQGGTNVLLSETGNLPAPVSGVGTPGTINGSIYAADPNDNDIPVTTQYNFTISQETKWRTVVQAGYIGSQTSKILMGGQSGAGNIINNGVGSIIDRNKMPLGALFLPDPVTGVISSDPENISKGAPNNQESDYRPFGSSYGTNAIIVPEHIGYSNYNALQLSWAKPAGAVTFNLNYTWQKALGTSLSTNPYSVGGNYGVLSIDRSHVINTSYSYRIPTYYHGDSRFVRGAAAEWTIAGLTTWQSGAYAPAQYNSNLGFTYNYTNLPDGYGNSSIGAPTYFGTTAAMAIMPALTCNPTSGLASRQFAKLGCFAPPAFGENGPRMLPYIKGPAYFNSDLTIAKLFHIGERQALEIKANMGNWLNHPLVQVSDTNQEQLVFNRDFVTGVVTATPKSSTWGTFNTKTGSNNLTYRILMLEAKYTF